MGVCDPLQPCGEPDTSRSRSRGCPHPCSYCPAAEARARGFQGPWWDGAGTEHGTRSLDKIRHCLLSLFSPQEDRSQLLCPPQDFQVPVSAQNPSTGTHSALQTRWPYCSPWLPTGGPQRSAHKGQTQTVLEHTYRTCTDSPTPSSLCSSGHNRRRQPVPRSHEGSLHPLRAPASLLRAEMYSPLRPTEESWKQSRDLRLGLHRPSGTAGAQVPVQSSVALA